jgi:hypothetical protein
MDQRISIEQFQSGDLAERFPPLRSDFLEAHRVIDARNHR